ncbi:MAG: cytochrome C oxidase subunit IV family protein [Gammaproteobacteria bacterium]|nr:cytochrome C oxidase subunit IV family protein [Pseudomonadales bacterium]MCP5347778.1 cytochrome C oxidase subunit IV family protein [Pseudomonadales bacterium]
MSAEAGQQHPLGIYYKVWVLLFVLSGFSYATDFLPDGILRWALILLFMVLKAGFIVAIFMHAFWERMALVFTILGPPIVLFLLIAFLGAESQYTWGTRVLYRGQDPNAMPVTVEEFHAMEHAAEAEH